MGTTVNVTIKKCEYCIPFISVIGVTWHYRESAPEFRKMCSISNWHKREFLVARSHWQPITMKVARKDLSHVICVRVMKCSYGRKEWL